METIQNFIYASLGTLGIYELMPNFDTNSIPMNDPDTLLKSAISLIAGVLSTILLKVLNGKKRKVNKKRRNIHKIKN